MADVGVEKIGESDKMIVGINMDMPLTCMSCRFCYEDYGFHCVFDSSIYTSFIKRPLFCPLVEVEQFEERI